jgi:hypothetical protein
MGQRITHRICLCCGMIQDMETGAIVDFPLDKLPAEIALKKMFIDNGVLARHPRKKGKTKKN